MVKSGYNLLKIPELPFFSPYLKYKTLFVALSKFEIENDMQDAVKSAFKNRPGLVENHPGFIRLDVICPFENPAEIWLFTYWTDEDTYQTWHKNHLKESHKGIPRGLKLKPKSFKLQFFNHISS